MGLRRFRHVPAFICMALIAPAALAEEAYIELVHEQLDAMSAEVAAKAEVAGATATDIETFEDLLASDTGHSYDFQTEAETSYFLVAACDADCGDIDLILKDGDDTVIAADETATDVPILIFDSEVASTMMVTANLYDCAVETCYYGVRLIKVSE